VPRRHSFGPLWAVLGAFSLSEAVDAEHAQRPPSPSRTASGKLRPSGVGEGRIWSRVIMQRFRTTSIPSDDISAKANWERLACGENCCVEDETESITPASMRRLHHLLVAPI
jgi:hypothetical protein